MSILLILKIFVLPIVRKFGIEWLKNKWDLSDELAKKISDASKGDPEDISELLHYFYKNKSEINKVREKINDYSFKEEVNKKDHGIFSPIQTVRYYSFLLEEIFEAAYHSKRPIILVGFVHNPNLVSYFIPNDFSTRCKPLLLERRNGDILIQGDSDLFGNAEHNAPYEIYVRPCESSESATQRAIADRKTLKTFIPDAIRGYQKLLIDSCKVLEISEHNVKLQRTLENDSLQKEIIAIEDSSGYSRLKDSFEDLMDQRIKDLEAFK